MNFIPADLKGSFVIHPNVLSDDRGWFFRTYCKDEFSKIGHNKQWLQMNHSYTKHRGTIRGMHYQLHPYGEIKLVRCIAGVVYDVIIDLRKGSSTFLQYFGIELSAENKKMIYIPEGFAHGFQTLSNNCEMIYQHTQNYSQASDMAIKYNEPKVAINWPFTVTGISERDNKHPLLDDNFKGI